MCKSPVLLITFNRPATTKKVIDAIKIAMPDKLYVFNDGPRDGNESDIAARAEIRQLIAMIDWDCKVFTNYSEVNLGCGLGVSGAISWAFENEDRLIILEDDTVPAKPFFTFCDTLLEKYKDDSRICMISGNNYTEHLNNNNDSYFFSLYGHIWGWATWKRAWDKFDFEMKDWPVFRNTNQISNVFALKREQRFFIKFYDAFWHKKEKHTWDYQWFYCRIREVGLSVIPKNNLVTNIGMNGVHTSKRVKFHFSPVNKDFVITSEPQFVLCNKYYDKHHFKQVIHKREYLIIRGIRKLGSMIK